MWEVPQGLRTNQGERLVLVFTLEGLCLGKALVSGHTARIWLGLSEFCDLKLTVSGMPWVPGSHPSTKEGLYTYIQILKNYESS